jgi:hypothetical protein
MLSLSIVGIDSGCSSAAEPRPHRRHGRGSGARLGRVRGARHAIEIGGIPRFLFGAAARDALRWLAAFTRGDFATRLAAETQLFYFSGQVRERLRARSPSA